MIAPIKAKIAIRPTAAPNWKAALFAWLFSGHCALGTVESGADLN